MRRLRACKSQGSIGMATLRPPHYAPGRARGIRVLHQRQPSSNLSPTVVAGKAKRLVRCRHESRDVRLETSRLVDDRPGRVVNKMKLDKETVSSCLFWSKTCEKDMAVVDAGAKKDLTSFVEGMDRKEKKELLGTRESRFQASNAAAPSIPVREPLQARRVQQRSQRRRSTPLTRPHLSPIFNIFRLSKSESRSTVPSLTSRFEKLNLPP